VQLCCVILVKCLAGAQAKVVKHDGITVIHDAQGNTIYPCGYRGGAKVRLSMEPGFEEAEVSLSSQAGIDQIGKEREKQVRI